MAPSNNSPTPSTLSLYKPLGRVFSHTLVERLTEVCDYGASEAEFSLNVGVNPYARGFGFAGVCAEPEGACVHEDGLVLHEGEGEVNDGGCLILGEYNIRESAGAIVAVDFRIENHSDEAGAVAAVGDNAREGDGDGGGCEGHIAECRGHGCETLGEDDALGHDAGDLFTLDLRHDSCVDEVGGVGATIFEGASL